MYVGASFPVLDVGCMYLVRIDGSWPLYLWLGQQQHSAEYIVTDVRAISFNSEIFDYFKDCVIYN